MSDPTIEQAVLGLVIQDNSLGAELLTCYEPSDFTGIRQQAFIQMAALIEAGSEVSPITIHKSLPEVLVSELHNWTYGLPFSRTVAHYAPFLKRQTALRRLARLGESLTTQAMNETADLAELIISTEGSLEDIRRRAKLAGRSFQTMIDISTEAGKVYHNLQKGNSNALPTGFSDIDMVTRGGIQPGDTWVIASQTGQGKTSWAINCAIQQAKQGVKVALVSREMSAFENFTRIHSAVSGVPLWRIKPGMSLDTWQQLSEWQDDVEGLPIWINCQTGNIHELRPQIREMVKNTGLQTLFVDYLQLMTCAGTGTATNRAQEVAMVSRTLKEIAMENNIGVFVLSQFNRYADHGERPEIHFLAESSGIEKDASLVLILQMKNREEGAQEWDCEMRIAKHRNGPLLTFPYRYSGETLTFKEAA